MRPALFEWFVKIYRPWFIRKTCGNIGYRTKKSLKASSDAFIAL